MASFSAKQCLPAHLHFTPKSWWNWLRATDETLFLPLNAYVFFNLAFLLDFFCSNLLFGRMIQPICRGLCFMNVLLLKICRYSTLCRSVPEPKNCDDSSCNVYNADPLLHSELVCWSRPTLEPSTRLTGAAPAGSNLSTIVFAEFHFWPDQIR